ncbi:hypothetical protein GJ496_007351 [Pomphorhynchus laevis]|nr:hypothetical protein GJ496_007351 [Pomphorhynchus laevis]
MKTKSMLNVGFAGVVCICFGTAVLVSATIYYMDYKNYQEVYGNMVTGLLIYQIIIGVLLILSFIDILVVELDRFENNRVIKTYSKIIYPCMTVIIIMLQVQIIALSFAGTATTKLASDLRIKCLSTIPLNRPHCCETVATKFQCCYNPISVLVNNNTTNLSTSNDNYCCYGCSNGCDKSCAYTKECSKELNTYNNRVFSILITICALAEKKQFKEELIARIYKKNSVLVKKKYGFKITTSTFETRF